MKDLEKIITGILIILFLGALAMTQCCEGEDCDKSNDETKTEECQKSHDEDKIECCGGESENCCSGDSHSHGDESHSHADAEEGHSHEDEEVEEESTE